MTHTMRYTLTRQVEGVGTTTTHHVNRYAALIYAYCVYGVRMSEWLSGRLRVNECRIGTTTYRITNPDGFRYLA